MKKDTNQEYRDAFNAEDAAEEIEALDPEVIGDDVADNATDETAPEGSGEEGGATDATAVAMTVEEGDGETETDTDGEEMAAEPDDEALSPEDTQRKNSWEGRLKKREEEIAAREAALAERDTPAMLADGGMVESEDEMMADGAEMDDPGTEPEAMSEESGAIDDEPAEDTSMDALMSEAREIAGSPERLEAKIAQDVADYGREYVVGYMALAMQMANAVAEPHVAAVQADLTSLIDDISGALRSMHRDTIADAHEDFEQVVSGEEFKSFLDGLPDEEKAKAAEVVENGSAGQIIKLLQTFKDSLKPKDSEPTPEDIWAEDAAAGVRGSAPVRLPTRAPASPDDEYKRAWDAA